LARPKNTARVDTRARIRKAGIEEFAARGYDGAGVDRIARKARVNKALIYYYFESKRGLYREILQDALSQLVAALSAVVERDLDARRKLDVYVDTLTGFLHDQKHLPPIMLRELAEGGRHLDVEALRTMAILPAVLVRLVGQGRREGAFSDIEPLMLHFVLLGTTMLMASNEPIRRRIRQLGLADPPIDRASTAAALRALARHITRKDDRNAPAD
jgi:TetR/AcrR family transcriptional regulator